MTSQVTTTVVPAPRRHIAADRTKPSFLTPRAAALDTLPAGARLNLADVLSLLDWSARTLTARIKAGAFPAPIAGEWVKQWRADTIRAFLDGEVQ